MRYLIFGVAMLLALSGCSDADSSSSPSIAPQVAPTTSAVSSTTAAPATSEGQLTTTTPVPATTTLPPRSLDELEVEVFEAASGFAQPVLMLTAPGDSRWFVVDQPGVVWIVVDGEASVFLDIRELVRFQGEQGLLGMAFHPEFSSNQLFYVNYIDGGGDSVVAALTAEGATANSAGLTEIVRVDQPAGNHNGGMLQFGPDGNLWAGFGDGGGANDQFGQGQRVDTLLAAMVRITVGPGIDGYDIPTGNIQDEVWAIGLRNPWRFAFDGDDLWIADVGQNRIEEVDVVDWTGGNPNFGWSVMEGSECFGSSDCDATDMVAPIYEYGHDDGCSITGGFVYRGAAMPELAGHYLFSDYCNGWLRSVDRAGDVREWLPETSFAGVTGFGIDASGEIYVLTSGGSIFGIRPVE